MKILNTVLSGVALSLFLFWFCGDPSYDCHTFAWRTDNHETFPPKPAVQVPVGEIVVYFDGEKPIHSGRYLGDGWVLSKWGQNPVVLHPIWLSIYGWDWKFYDVRN